MFYGVLRYSMVLLRVYGIAWCFRMSYGASLRVCCFSLFLSVLCCTVLWVIEGCCKVLQGVSGCCRVLFGVIGICRVLSVV